MISTSNTAIDMPGRQTLQATNPATRSLIPETFAVATEEEVNRAVENAQAVCHEFRNSTGQQRGRLLRTIAAEIEKLGDTLLTKVMEESGLPLARVTGERGRTCNQLRLFAALAEEGSWVEATIDEAQPDRQPVPKADLRKMLQAIGVVVVFPASNFPLAFSTAGGDTASALAAGCPVVVKAHPSHPGTNDLVAGAIGRALEQCDMPQGIFSSLMGEKTTGQALVQHPFVKAVGFTGSLKVGKALFDLANSRPEPIPVYAEMGSNNPVFLLPNKLKQEASTLATTIAGSVNLGAGQFCTKPGILVVKDNEDTMAFLTELKSAFSELKAATMLNAGIHKAYQAGKQACCEAEGVDLVYGQQGEDDHWQGQPGFATVSAQDFLNQEQLQEEVFGPFLLVVLCRDSAAFLQIANQMQGQLTATVMGTSAELRQASALIDTLTVKAGRVIFNGVPTGVEVCPAMHHGGPFPATTNSLYTSVGTDAIKRFARPVAFQNAPDALLPAALQAQNPLRIWRILNGQKSQS